MPPSSMKSARSVILVQVASKHEPSHFKEGLYVFCNHLPELMLI